MSSFQVTFAADCRYGGSLLALDLRSKAREDLSGAFEPTPQCSAGRVRVLPCHCCFRCKVNGGNKTAQVILILVEWAENELGWWEPSGTCSGLKVTTGAVYTGASSASLPLPYHTTTSPGQNPLAPRNFHLKNSLSLHLCSFYQLLLAPPSLLLFLCNLSHVSPSRCFVTRK